MATVKRQYKVKLHKGKVRYYYTLVGGNGEVMMTSQKYFSRGNAEREAAKVASKTESIYSDK